MRTVSRYHPKPVFFFEREDWVNKGVQIGSSTDHPILSTNPWGRSPLRLKIYILHTTLALKKSPAQSQHVLGAHVQQCPAAGRPQRRCFISAHGSLVLCAVEFLSAGDVVYVSAKKSTEVVCCLSAKKSRQSGMTSHFSVPTEHGISGVSSIDKSLFRLPGNSRILVWSQGAPGRESFAWCPQHTTSRKLGFCLSGSATPNTGRSACMYIY